jgi:hypothetical protein
MMQPAVPYLIRVKGETLTERCYILDQHTVIDTRTGRLHRFESCTAWEVNEYGTAIRRVPKTRREA